jgi:hypothetical protein
MIKRVIITELIALFASAIIAYFAIAWARENWNPELWNKGYRYSGLYAYMCWFIYNLVVTTLFGQLIQLKLFFDAEYMKARFGK